MRPDSLLFPYPLASGAKAQGPHACCAEAERREADRIAEHIANSLMQPGSFEEAARRYNTTDEFEIGERAAREYIAQMGT